MNPPADHRLRDVDHSVNLGPATEKDKEVFPHGGIVFSKKVPSLKVHFSLDRNGDDIACHQIYWFTPADYKRFTHEHDKVTCRNCIAVRNAELDRRVKEVLRRNINE